MEIKNVTPVASGVVPAKPANSVARFNEGRFLEVANNFVQGENGIEIAPNYDYKTAVKTLYLQCLDLKDKNGKPALEVCTLQSVEKAVREMLAKGLNPIKKQVYPVVYGDQLVLMDSYMGKQRNAYATGNVVKGSIRAQIIYENDTFIDKILSDGRRILVKHEQPEFSKRSTNRIGAYCTYQKIVGNKVLFDMNIMTRAQLDAAHTMSKTSCEVHKKFGEDMDLKTIISNTCKKIYSWSDESVNVFNETNDIDLANNAAESPTIEDNTVYDISLETDNNEAVDGNTTADKE